MKLRDIIVFGGLTSLAFWIGLNGTGSSSSAKVQAKSPRTNSISDKGTVGPSSVTTGEENPAPESDSGGPRAVWNLPAIPAEDTDDAADTFQFELAGFLMSSERSYAELPRLWRRAPSLRPALARAVGEAQNREGLRFLASVLGEDPEVDPVLLSEIGRLAPLADVGLALDVAEPLRWVAKSSNDVTAIQASVFALGRLHDEESIPLLIALLDDGSGGVRTRAARALEEITGLSYRDDSARWTAWFESEQDWFDDHADELLYQLESETEEEVFDAVRGLAKVRLHRDEVANEILMLLQDENPSVRRLACQGLSQLGSPVAVMPLVECLADQDDSVVQSAWIALRWLTGLNLPAEDQQAWLEATEERFS